VTRAELWSRSTHSYLSACCKTYNSSLVYELTVTMANVTELITNLETPDWLDTGDNAWQLTAASFVALQSVPGLTVLYAGLVKRKWAINSMFMAFYAFAMVLICWVIWAYSEYDR